MVQAHRTSSNLLKPQQRRDSKVWRGLSHDFGVVRLYQTFSIYIIAGETRCAMCLCTSSGLFKAHRTSSNLLEPQHHRDSKVWRGLTYKFGVVQMYRTFSIHIIEEETRCAGCLCTSLGWFKHIEPHRIYSNHNTTEIARCREVCHISSMWFDGTEPSLSTLLQEKQGVQGAYVLVRGCSTSLQGKQGVQGAYAQVWGGSSTSNLIEPTLNTTSQR